MMRRLIGALLVAALLLPQIASTSGQTGQAVTHRYPSVSVGGNINAVAVQGSLAYVGEGSKLTIIDTSNPAAPQRLGSVNLSGPVTAVKVAGTRAYAVTQTAHYLADPRNQMVIINIRNPAAPSILSSTRLGKGGQSLDVAGELVYVGRGSCCVIGQEEAGLIVFDTTNVLSPTVRTKFVINNLVMAVHVDGTKAYIISYNTLTILDASVSPPAILGDFNLGNRAIDMEVAGDYAYITTDNGTMRSLEVLDIRVPGNIQRADSVDLVQPFRSIAVENDRAYLFGGSYIVDRSEIRVMDISNPHDVSQIDRGLGGYDAKDGVVVNATAYLADGNSGLRLFNVSDPASIDELGLYLLAPAPVALWGDGERGYVAEAPRMSEPGAVRIIDHSGPQPAQVGSLTERTKAIRVIGDTAYLLTEQGLRIADVSDPAQPQWQGAISIAEPKFLEVQGNFAYVTSWFSPTLSVIDISQPLTPTLRARYATPQRAAHYGLWVEGDKAYIVRADVGIMIVDIKNPDAIAQVGGYGAGRPFEIDGTTAYVFKETYGKNARYPYYAIDIVDLSNLAAPALVSTYTLNAPAKAIVVDRGRAFVATQDFNYSSTINFMSAIHILEVSDPAQPRLKETIATNGDPTDLQLVGNQLYVNEGNNGFRVIDVTPQADPQRIFLPLVRR